MTKYWFRQKRFGYGATPNTWQGWALTIVAGALVFGVILTGPIIRDNLLRGAWIVSGLVVVLVPAVLISHAKTEGGWRWRSGK